MVKFTPEQIKNLQKMMKMQKQQKSAKARSIDPQNINNPFNMYFSYNLSNY